MHPRTKLLFLLLLLCLLLCGCARQQAAAPAPAAEARLLSLPQPGQRPAAEQLPVYIDGLLLDRACRKDGVLYLSPAAVCSWLEIPCTWQGDDSAFTLTLQGVDFTGDSSREYLSGNGRYFYAPEGWFTSGGCLYLPCDLLCRFLCLDAVLSADGSRLDISTLNARVIPGGEDYYELNYPSEDLFWLTQIIYAESWQQPLAGQIGVGNVVLNRVAGSDFPSTVFDVIFDMEHTIQFEPITNGSVYATPDEQSRIAACLCLDGYNTVGDSLYFVNPAHGSGWFDASLDLTVTIGGHNFYSVRGA